MKRFVGHRRTITAASLHGAQLLTASMDGTARLWDLASASCVVTFEPHPRGVRDAALSRDGARVITVSDDYGVREWDAKSGKLLALHKGHTSRVTSVACADDGSFATASHDGSVRVWKDGDSVRLGGHAGGAVGVRSLGRGKWETVADNGKVYTWANGKRTGETKVKKQKPGALMGNDDGTVTLEGRVIGEHDDSVVFVLDAGEQIVSCAADGTICAWDRREPPPAARQPMQPQPLRRLHAMKLDADVVPHARVVGDELAVGFSEHVVMLDAKSYAVRRRLDFPGEVIAVAGSSLAFDSWQQRLSIVDATSGRLSKAYDLEEHGRVARLGATVAFFTSGLTLHLIDVTTGRERAVCGPMPGAEAELYLGERFVLVPREEGGGGWLWSLADGARVAELEWEGESPNAVAFHGDRVFLTTHDGRCYVFDRGERVCELVPPVKDDGHVPLVLSPRGDRLVTHGRNNVHANLWDARSGKRLARLFADRKVGSLSGEPAFSPDGSRVIAAHYAEPILVFLDDRGRVVASHDVHRGGGFRDVRCVFFGGSVLTYGGVTDRSVRAWDVASGARLWALLNVPKPSGNELFTYVVKSPNDRWLTTTQEGAPGPLVIDLAHGRIAAQLDGHTAYLREPLFFGGDRLLTGCNDHVLQVWQLA